MRKIRLVLVQPVLAEGAVAANWRAARNSLARAGACEADLVVLPEMWLTGYAYRRLAELAKGTHESLAKVGALAKKYGYFVVGSWAELGEEGHLQNTACLIGPDGRVQARYRKVHLFGPMKETRHFLRGREAVVADLPIGKIGLALCYDLRFPELARRMALARAELLLYPAQWPEVRVGHFHTLLAARAIENQLFTAGANRAGRSAAVQFGGGSMVVGPRGEVLAELGPEEGFIEIDIDLDQVAESRSELTYLADRVREVDEFLYR